MNALSAWSGCHGVRVDGVLDGWGRVHGAPITEATVELGEVEEPGSGPLWIQRAVVDCLLVERRLHKAADGRLVLTGNRGPRVALDVAAGAVTVDGGPAFLQRQLVAAFALPLLLHDKGVLVMHGAALQRDGEAVLICGASGVGKSSAMVTLGDAGWTPLSEDACAISLVGDQALVWPGPPWVRVTHDEPGPTDATVIERGVDKTAWSIQDRHAEGPAVVRRIVLLEPPGGDEATDAVMSPGEAIGALARHGVWLGEPVQRRPTLFSLLSALVPRVVVSRMQLPRAADWRLRLRAEFDHVVSA